MKKSLILLSAILIFGTTQFAYGFQTPAQQSSNTITAVLSSILSDSGLALRSITKIQVSKDGAKAQLVDQAGECLAIPYEVSFDAMGFPTATPNKASLAICD